MPVPPPRHLSRRLGVLAVAVCAATGLAVATAPPGSAAPSPASPPPGVAPGESPAFFDARTGVTAAQSEQVQGRRVAGQNAAAAVALRSALGTQALVDIDGLTGTPRQVARLDGFLTGASTASPDTVARGYLTAHSDVFHLTASEVEGLVLGRDYVDVSGVHHLSYQQVAGGVRLFGNGVRADVTKAGQLVQVTGSPVAGLTAQALPAAARTASADAAIRVAKQDTHETDTAPTARDTATPVLFRSVGGTRRAWQTVTMSARVPTLDVVDAASGRLLYRDPLADDYEAATPGGPNRPAAVANRTALVVDNYPGAARGGTFAKVSLTDPGWLPSGSKTLVGNNVHTFVDLNDNNATDPGEEIVPTAASGYEFTNVPFSIADEPCSSAQICTWDPAVARSWQKNSSRTATQNFYFINKYHDHLQASPIGFTEAAGNFQTTNATGQGRAGDAVDDQSLDGANTANGFPDTDHIDNANFATPPDGTSPTMQMYLFHQPGATFAQDPFLATTGSDEADIVYHEYTHGLSHRLVVDADNVPALDSLQGASMGEAWSDWYALDFLADEGYLQDKAAIGDVLVGAYVSGGEALIRSEPTDCPVGTTAAACPGAGTAGRGGYTYGDMGKISGSGNEVHADGEIWAQTLWDVRTALGSGTTEALVTRGMELSPTFPSMLDMRNAILLADRTVYGGAHTATLWKLFAARGMGYFAGTVTGGDGSPVENFSAPPAAGGPTGTINGVVTDSQTDRPVAAVTVSLGGHDSGLPGASFTATSSATGKYTISGVPVGTYPDLFAIGAGYDLSVKPTVKVTSGATTKANWSLVRDWAAASGGGTIGAFTGPDYTDFGCGPGGDIDQSLGTGWGSESDLDANSRPTAATPKYAVLELPRAVDVSGISIDPSNTCGDAASAATGSWRVDVSRNGTTFTKAATGTFTPDDLGRLNPITLPSGLTGIVAVRFWMFSPQVVTRGLDCSTGSYSGCQFMDSSEVEVYGSAH